MGDDGTYLTKPNRLPKSARALTRVSILCPPCRAAESVAALARPVSPIVSSRLLPRAAPSIGDIGPVTTRAGATCAGEPPMPDHFSSLLWLAAAVGLLYDDIDSDAEDVGLKRSAEECDADFAIRIFERRRFPKRLYKRQ